MRRGWMTWWRWVEVKPLRIVAGLLASIYKPIADFKRDQPLPAMWEWPSRIIVPPQLLQDATRDLLTIPTSRNCRQTPCKSAFRPRRIFCALVFHMNDKK